MFSLFFLDWILDTNQDVAFQDLSPTELAKLLRRFYAEVRNKEGQQYNHNTMKSIRASINRHLTSPPYNKPIDICKDSVFKEANNVFQGILKENKRTGNDKTKKTQAICKADWLKLHSSPAVLANTPQSLQNKVFINIMTHFGRRGREGLRDLKKSSFNIKKDSQGREYVECAYNEVSKNHQTSGLTDGRNQTESVMYEQPDETCPVKSFKRYINLLDPNCDVFFTLPKRNWKNQSVWYTSMPLGKNTWGFYEEIEQRSRPVYHLYKSLHLSHNCDTS